MFVNPLFCFFKKKAQLRNQLTKQDLILLKQLVLSSLLNPLSLCSLLIILLYHTHIESQCTKCINFRINFCITFFHFLLDKICNLWYNGKLGAPRPQARHAIISYFVSLVNKQNAQKNKTHFVYLAY